jgi:hypothetical protein
MTGISAPLQVSRSAYWADAGSHRAAGWRSPSNALYLLSLFADRLTLFGGPFSFVENLELFYFSALSGECT